MLLHRQRFAPSRRNAYISENGVAEKKTQFHMDNRNWLRRSHPLSAAISARTQSSASARAPSTVLTADSGKDSSPNRLGPNDPKLPPRPVKKQTVRGVKGSGGGGGDGGGSGGGPRVDRKLASLIVYTGVVGTTAITLAGLVGIDLWDDFDFASWEDIRLAVVASIPLQLTNCALLLPSFASERPAFLTSPEEDPQVAAAVAAATTAATAASASGTAAATSDSVTGASSRAAGKDEEASTRSEVVAAEAGTSAAADAARQASHSQAGPSGGAGSPQAARSSPPAGVVPAASWGAATGRGDADGAGEGSKGALEDLRSALHLAQGYYISNNPTAKLPASLETAYALVDSAAGEMLYRGVALTWLASWLMDRVTEAGMEEMVTEQLPASIDSLAGGGLAAQKVVAAVGLYGICEVAVSAAVVTFVVLSVLDRSRRAARQLEMVLKGVAATAAQRARASNSGKAAAAGGKPGGEVPGAQGPKAEPQLVLGPGGPDLVGASAAGVVMQRAAVIQASRDAFQLLLLNGLFIFTGGNLAASYTAAVINQLVISALQRRGVRRMKERNARFMKELREYNAQVLKIIAKQKDKLSKTAADRVEAMSREDGTTSTSTSTSASSVSSPPTAVAPAAATASTPAAASTSSTAALASGIQGAADTAAPLSPPSTSAAGTDVGRRSGLESALAMLDQLVPEPPKPAKQQSGPPGSAGKTDAQQQQS